MIKMNPEQETAMTVRGIDKDTLYRALTGYGRLDEHPRAHIAKGHPVGIDVSVAEMMDAAFLMVTKMQRMYRGDNPLAEYYETCFNRVNAAYLDGNPKEMKDALQELIDAIYAE